MKFFTDTRMQQRKAYRNLLRAPSSCTASEESGDVFDNGSPQCWSRELDPGRSAPSRTRAWGRMDNNDGDLGLPSAWHHGQHIEGEEKHKP
jgi:hypothetical protein